MTDELTGMDLEGNGSDAIKTVSQHLTGGDEENREKPATTAAVPVGRYSKPNISRTQV
jgi:hypothetical protein